MMHRHIWIQHFLSQ